MAADQATRSTAARKPYAARWPDLRRGNAGARRAADRRIPLPLQTRPMNVETVAALGATPTTVARGPDAAVAMLCPERQDVPLRFNRGGGRSGRGRLARCSPGPAGTRRRRQYIGQRSGRLKLPPSNLPAHPMKTRLIES